MSLSPGTTVLSGTGRRLGTNWGNLRGHLISNGHSGLNVIKDCVYYDKINTCMYEKSHIRILSMFNRVILIETAAEFTEYICL